MPSILLWTPKAQYVPGGHDIQLSRTADALRIAGVEVTTSRESEPSLDGFSLVHGSGLTVEQVRRCRAAGLAVCLSTIYWSRRYTLGLDQHMGQGLQVGRRIRLALVLAVASSRLRHIEKSEGLLRTQVDTALMYESADVLLPNSALEARTIRAELGITTPSVVVPNGIDEALFGMPLPVGKGRDQTVLFVGRFEPHKNQLGLIRALAGRPYRLVLAGPAHPDHLRYREDCVRAAGANVEFVAERSQKDLVDLYLQARVHVLPSWYETTGLVSLEAAALGCNVVTTNRGYAREYLGSLAGYCDPADAKSIARAVDDAIARPPDQALRDRVLRRFTWRAAGEATLNAYREVLTQRASAGGRRS